MRVSIHAVGRMKAGPERELATRYVERFRRAGPALGLEWGGVAEIAESRASSPGQRREEEGRVLLAACGGAALVLLDETGAQLDSAGFAARIARFRDEGARNLAFAIGGPDGHDRDLLGPAALVLSLGRPTWPHQIARILLVEQLYRATTILSGHPYHRA